MYPTTTTRSERLYVLNCLSKPFFILNQSGVLNTIQRRLIKTDGHPFHYSDCGRQHTFLKPDSGRLVGVLQSGLARMSQ